MTFLEAVKAAQDGTWIRPAGWLGNGEAVIVRNNEFLARSFLLTGWSALIPEVLTPTLVLQPWEVVTQQQIERERESTPKASGEPRDNEMPYWSGKDIAR